MIYIPYPRVNCLKTIPFTAAHTYIAHIWQCPPPGGTACEKNGARKSEPHCCSTAKISLNSKPTQLSLLAG